MTERGNILGNERHILHQMLKGDDSNWQEQAGCSIGAYTLVEQLGEGGFGMVWRAQQTAPVRREVALKLIKLGMDTVQVLGRFDLERQALASMEHPHIAALLDAGATPDGRPYFVMELVNGQPITEYCKELQLGLEQRLRLFQLVCLAVQHAHQKGIIHRDLKPNNIIVCDSDDTALPKIIDFGIAKAIKQDSLLDFTLVTRHDIIIGTPLYMSPEQLEGVSDIDTRSDIYALGVILYELLTDKVPFDVNTTSMAEMLRMLREDQPQRPSTRVFSASWQNPQVAATGRSRLPADLDWITLRALAKERQRRYSSAAELAADVERYLQHEPVLAHPPSFSYTASRWIRRHRTSFIAACICVMAMVSGTLLALWQANVAKAAQHAAEQQRFRAETEARRALEAERSAKHESQRVKEVSTFLTTLLEQIADQVDKGRNPEALRLGLLQSQSALDQIKDDPELRAQLLQRLASIWDSMGERKPAIPMLKEWAQLMGTIHDPHSDEAQDAQIRYLRMVTDHGPRSDAPALIRNVQRAEEKRGQLGSRFWFDLQRLLVRVFIKLDSAQEAVTASELLMEQAKQRKLKNKSLYHCLMARAYALETVQRFSEAEALLQECVKIADSLKQPDGMQQQIDDRLLSIQEQSGQPQRGAQIIHQILERQKKKLGAEHRTHIPLIQRLALLESKALMHQQAEAHAEEALQLAQQHASSATKRGTESFRETVILALQTQAKVFSAAGKHDLAIQKAKASVNQSKTVGNSATLCDATQQLGRIYESANLLEEAYVQYDLCVKNRQQRDANYKSRLDEMGDMCQIRIKQARYEEAMQLALQFWKATQQDPEASADSAHMAYAASVVWRCWESVKKAKPAMPEPPELTSVLLAIQTALGQMLP